MSQNSLNTVQQKRKARLERDQRQLMGAGSVASYHTLEAHEGTGGHGMARIYGVERM